MSSATPVDLPEQMASPIKPMAQPASRGSYGLPSERRNTSPISPELDTADTVQRFHQLLNQQDFDHAITFYEENVSLNDAHQGPLRRTLEEYLQSCLYQCGDGTFITLVNAWLAAYYDDIPVLLMLAEYQQDHGFPGEAAKVLQMARTYAYQPNQSELVTSALRQLVNASDDALSQQEEWAELLGFYELLEAIALSEPIYRLRQAMIYRVLGEPSRARALLLALQANDNSLDPQLTKTVALQLAETTAVPQVPAVPPNAVPLIRQGAHYLIETTLNNRQQVTLMIDTGASITSLTRASFDGMNSTDFAYSGSHLFNTANGLTQGEVYNAASIALGGSRLDGIEVAVLDFEPPRGVDGLLGMNVLRNYRFQIDQEKALLYLQPR